MGDFLPDWVEQAFGVFVIVLVLLDVYSTVLYARAGSGLISRLIARALWYFFRALASLYYRGRGTILSLCGPTILVALFLGWGFMLAVGAGLVIHPVLGSSVISTSRETPTDFVTAMFAGGSSLSVIGSSDFEPQTRGFRLLFLFHSLIGMATLTLTLTYLLQVYNALQFRNTYALKIHLASGATGDAAELLAGIGPEDKYDIGYTNLSDMAECMTQVNESHHFFAVLFFFRFRQPYYSMSRTSLIALDTVSLMKSALDDEEHSWLKESLATVQLWRAAMMMIETMAEAFLEDGKEQKKKQPDAEMLQLWRRRYDAALRRLRGAHIKTITDEEAGFENYVKLRCEWDGIINSLAPRMFYDLEDVDTALNRPEAADERKDFQGRWHSAG